MVAGKTRYGPDIIKNSVRISDILHKDAAIWGRNVPTTLDQAKGEPAAGYRCTNIFTGNDGAYAIGQYVMSGYVTARSYGDIAGLRAESACARVVLGVAIVALDRQVAGDIAASEN